MKRKKKLTYPIACPLCMNPLELLKNQTYSFPLVSGYNATCGHYVCRGCISENYGGEDDIPPSDRYWSLIMHFTDRTSSIYERLEPIVEPKPPEPRIDQEAWMKEFESASKIDPVKIKRKYEREQ